MGKGGSGLIDKLVDLDKYYSGKIHGMEMPAIFQAWVCAWSMLFNRELTFTFLIFVAGVIPLYLDHHQPYYALYYGTQYFTQGWHVLIMTVLAKKWIRRPRPAHNTKVWRIRNIRGKENDTSFPSGDTGQVAVLIGFVYLNMYPFVEKLPGKEFALLFVLLNVAFARVFF